MCHQPISLFCRRRSVSHVQLLYRLFRVLSLVHLFRNFVVHQPLALTSVEDRRYYLEVEQLLTFLPITDSAPEKDTKQKTQDDEDRN